MVYSGNSSVAEGTFVVGPVGRSRVVSEAVVCASASAGSPSSIMTDGVRLEEIEEVRTKSRSDSQQLKGSLGCDGNRV
jgi:hypothetical protein